MKVSFFLVFLFLFTQFVNAATFLVKINPEQKRQLFNYSRMIGPEKLDAFSTKFGEFVEFEASEPEWI